MTSLESSASLPPTEHEGMLLGGWAETSSGAPPVTQTAPAPDALPRYRFDGEIARGGMGVVYRAWDLALGRGLAIKVLLEGHDRSPELRGRFVREASITGRLQHPGIVPVHDVGELPDGRPYFAMQLMRGESLSALLAGRTSPAESLPPLLKLFERVCEASAYAHAAGIIHRDLKPANVIAEPFGVVKVMDWGVAKALNEADPPLLADAPEPAPERGLTESGRVLGTPAYMAPEQARAEAVDERADVFGLGAILCEILTGQPPYACTDGRKAHRRATRAHLSGAVQRLMDSAAPREVVNLAIRCLAAKPADRPANAGEVSRAMTAYMESDLRRAERDLARFFDLSLDLFCIAGVDGYFRRINPNFSRLLGHPDGELLARPFIDFIHPEDHAATCKAMGELRLGLPVARFRNRYRDARGNYRTFEWTAKSVPDEGVIFAVARDVTGRP